jgi:hypothetical protein
MEKLTAIEWLIDQWPILKSQLPSWLIKQALDMEKEQILKAYHAGYDDVDVYEPEKYYNETYKKY